MVLSDDKDAARFGEGDYELHEPHTVGVVSLGSGASIQSAVASAVTSPAFFGGSGMTVVSVPQAPLAALLYAVTTLWSLRNELQASKSPNVGDESKEPGYCPEQREAGAHSLFKKFLKSPSLVLSIGAGLSFLTSATFVLQEDPALALAFFFSGIGNSTLAALVNKQLGYRIFDEKIEQGGSVSRILPEKLTQLLANPVLSFATCNMLFSAASPGVFSNLPQIIAFGVGVAFGTTGIMRGSMSDSSALKSSFLYGAAANVAFGVNAFLGGALYSAAALGLWTLQNISAWAREKGR